MRSDLSGARQWHARREAQPSARRIMAWAGGWGLAAVCLGALAVVPESPDGELPAALSVSAYPQAVLDHHGEEQELTGEPAEVPHDDGAGLPLEPARTVSVDTRTATWLSLDLSPDDSTLVFELLGDIYTLPATGGEATALLSGMAFESQPTYSPDGSMIAFISDRDGAENLWIANADGSDPRKLSAEAQGLFTSPEWSADGQYVLVSRSSWGLRTYELWMYHKDGGSGLQLTKAKATPTTPQDQRLNVLGVQASSDGQYLYYARKQGGFEYNLTLPQWSIWRRSLDDGTDQVIATAAGSAMRPVLSHDGNTLVYATRHDAETALRVLDLSTGQDRWLLYPVTRDDQESRFTRDLMPAASFTADDSALITTFDGAIQRVTLATGETEEIPFHAKTELDIGPDLDLDAEVETGPIKVRLIQSPALSPVGDQVVLSALGELYVHALGEDGATRQLEAAGQGAFMPSWAPDGLSIVYASWGPEGGHLWRLGSSRNARPAQLTQRIAYYADPVVSPDGRYVVALRASARNYLQREFDFGSAPGMDLVRVPVEGGEAELIAHAAGFSSPQFAGSSDRVYAYTPGGLISMRLDGSDRRTHLQVKGTGLYFAEEPVPASDIRISPKGDWALAHVGNQLHLVAVPRFDREGVTVKVDSPNVPHKQLSDLGADYFGWAADGESVYWAIGASLHRQAIASISFRDEPSKEKDDEASGGDGGDPAADAEDEGAGAEEETVLAEAVDEEAEESWPPALKEQADAVERFDIRIEVPRDVPAGAMVLRGAKVITMRGDETIDNADVLVVNNRISQIGPSGTLELPADTRVVDVTGKVITPGFVDTHAHWFEIRRGVIDTNHWGFLANVAYGVTAGLDVQTATNDMFAYQDMIDAGRMIGLRAFSTGPGVFSDNAFSSRDHAYGVLKRYRDYYRTRNIKAYLSGNRKQRQYLMQAAAELGMLPTTEGALDLKLDLTHAIDGFWGTEHALAVTPVYDDVVQLIAGTGIGYTPTLLVAYGGPWAENYFYTRESPYDDAKVRRFMPHDVLAGKSLRRRWFADQEHVFPRLAADAARIMRAGGKVGVGSHGQFQGLGYHWELWALASGGLTPMEALRAATLGGAEVIGYEAAIGSLEPGKYADLNVFDRDPSEDIRNTAALSLVMANGRLYDAGTLMQLAPNEVEAPVMWFAGEAPPNRLHQPQDGR